MKKHLLAAAITVLAAGTAMAQATDTLAKIKDRGSVNLGVRDSSGLAFTLGGGKRLLTLCLTLRRLLLHAGLLSGSLAFGGFLSLLRLALLVDLVGLGFRRFGRLDGDALGVVAARDRLGSPELRVDGFGIGRPLENGEESDEKDDVHAAREDGGGHHVP